jgi:hypothetical protein
LLNPSDLFETGFEKGNIRRDVLTPKARYRGQIDPPIPFKRNVITFIKEIQSSDNDSQRARKENAVIAQDISNFIILRLYATKVVEKDIIDNKPNQNLLQLSTGL